MSLNPCDLAELLACNLSPDDEMFKQMVVRGLLDIRTELRTLNNGELLGQLTGADFNVTTDQPINMNAAKYALTAILVTNVSTSMTTAVGGIYLDPAKANAVVANTQIYSALVSAQSLRPLTLTAMALQNAFTDTNLYFSLSTPQGAAATGDIYVYGRRLA